MKGFNLIKNKYINNFKFYKFNTLNTFKTIKRERIIFEWVEENNLNLNLEIIEKNNYDADLIFYTIFQFYINQNMDKIELDYLIDLLSDKLLNDFNSLNLIKLSNIAKIWGEMKIKNEIFWKNLEDILNTKSKLKLFNINNLINIIEGFYKVNRLFNLKNLSLIEYNIKNDWRNLNQEQKEIFYKTFLN